ncbi:uncharacterized protein LOC62_03G005149 [Vanrija pseudolonga]|uniref:AB hydrolase-1 domain-containing protein n=1 Tax=Vanrija pseudolonga TaxID=143232 RepID=A0AAF1BHX0_9TREE|nr:hypothetical protein LOC62_03G005149 [Vanrija pseudolonga]
MSNSKTKIHAENEVAKAHGIFHPAADAGASSKPLLVLIHGTGTNASYFDNELHSIPANFNKLGYNVLNVNRPGYGTNPIPSTSRPVFSTPPLYAQLINDAYDNHHKGSDGVILIGHSLGAATSLILAALEGDNIPLRGVSALGVVPAKTRPDLSLFEGVFSDAKVERLPLPAEPSAQDLKLFLGVPDFFDLAHLPRLEGVFEGAVKHELTEWTDLATYEKFVNEILPAVKVPLQFLAAEIELHWQSLEQAQPIFDEVAAQFTGVPRIDKELLPGGAHNFEFSTNSALLQKKREEFVNSLTKNEV